MTHFLGENELHFKPNSSATAQLRRERKPSVMKSFLETMNRYLSGSIGQRHPVLVFSDMNTLAAQ
jgi:hypothetical protein